MIRKSELKAEGFRELSDNEYSKDGMMVILLSKDTVSLISESFDEGLFSVPIFRCGTVKSLIKFLDKCK